MWVDLEGDKAHPVNRPAVMKEMVLQFMKYDMRTIAKPTWVVQPQSAYVYV